ncbi:exosortase F system-associated membrane protein [Halpernia frigidisoli]|uniref:Exosortase F-associated protein n=1 Tax=Halpernia frigidisoli TaxID=1125876 RepID=A0A1I3HJN0_9FLAO|nr:exosortase F system-associated protein [Halpernia frigidisoli]SFI35946.1 exosortase F-associated protein [Halpernia frigidisoli]
MKSFKWIFVLLALAGLIAVRTVEDRLFYDPFLDFFKSADVNAKFPAFNWWPLVLNYLFRFGLNLVFSLVIIQALFQNKKWTLQALVLISIVFSITFSLYLICISTKFEIGYLFSFYMRRFVIQPLILLLIVPLFYYRKAQLEKGLEI